MVKHVDIDAEGDNFAALMSGGEHLSRVESVRFKMQVDPPLGLRITGHWKANRAKQIIGRVHDRWIFLRDFPKAIFCFFSHNA